MGSILVVYHTQTGNTLAAAEAVAAGARDAGAEVVVKEGLKADVDDLMNCDGIAVGTPDYFSYMAGGLKDFFDRVAHPTDGKIDNKPAVLFVTHGGGGSAVDSLTTIAKRMKFNVVADPVLVKNKPDAEAEAQLREIGAALAKASAT